MNQPVVVVDAFTNRPFAGNPAAVCVLKAARDDAWMQNVACEMNLSETAFLVARAATAWDLRWFTPGGEVDLCGHATLGSAHALWESGAPFDASLQFHTRSGVLQAKRIGAWIELDFPASTVTELKGDTTVATALRAQPVFVGRSRFDLFAEYATEAEVRALSPDFGSFAETRGIIATALADSGRPYDFVSRFFAPACGIPEDPVTGSAHCALGPYWSERLGRQELVGYQCSRRGGTVRVRVRDDRVDLGGQAVTVWRGELIAG